MVVSGSIFDPLGTSLGSCYVCCMHSIACNQLIWKEDPTVLKYFDNYYWWQLANVTIILSLFSNRSNPSVLTDTHAVAAASLHSPVQEGAVHTDPPLPPDDHDAEKTPVVFSIDVPCNANCSCSRRRYNPVCGVDGLQYFSPCHAGCTQTSSVGGKTVSIVTRFVVLYDKA